MDQSNLPLPPASSSFVGGATPRSHRSHHAAGFSLAEMLYNCRLSGARELEARRATPRRDAAELILDLLK